MHRTNINSAPSVFLDKPTKPHYYRSIFSQLNYAKPNHKFSRCNYRISIKSSFIWNELLTKKRKINRINFQL